MTAGSRILATSAMGRAYLAGLTDRERTPLIDQIIRKYPDDKAAAWCAASSGRSKEIEKRGFCLGIGDWRKDVNGAERRWRCRTGRAVYALNCGGPAYLLKARDIEESYGPRLVEIASKGGRPDRRKDQALTQEHMELKRVRGDGHQAHAARRSRRLRGRTDPAANVRACGHKTCRGSTWRGGAK